MKNYNSGQISFGGYPRSGNHTLGRVLTFAFPHREVSWLLHRITDIAVAPNCVISIRRPVEAVGSWIEFREETAEDKADAYLEWFCRYFSQLNKRANQIAILSLDDLMTKPYECADAVSHRFGLEPSALVNRGQVEEWLLYNSPMHLPNATSPNKVKWYDRIQDSSFYEEASELYQIVLEKRLKISND